MALVPEKLDDLTWSQMVRAARDHIASASNGQWTLHAPVDPGVTLLELLAAQLEQRLYWMDQPSDDRSRALLLLLGVKPRDAVPAATVMVFDGSKLPTGTLQKLKAETVMWLDDQTERLAFSTQSALTVLPIKLAELKAVGRSQRWQILDDGVQLRVGGLDRTNDLKAGRAPFLLPEEGDVREAEIALCMNQTISSAGPDDVGLLFELHTPGGIQPGWSPDAADDVPPPAELSWWYDAGDHFEKFDAAAVRDGTGGLRRSGVVQLQIPDASRPRVRPWVGIPDVEKGVVIYRLRLRSERSSYTFTPRVRRILPNAVVALNRRPAMLNEKDERMANQVGRWKIRLPGNELRLPEDQHPPLSVRLRLCESDGQKHDWTSVNTLAFSRPGDRHFVVSRDDGRLIFGDGLNGRLPVLNEAATGSPPESDPGSLFDLNFDVGGGMGGNLSPSRHWISRDYEDLNAINAVSAVGGADPESLEEAVARAQSELKQRDRAVTREDFIEMAKTTKGVAIARAQAVAGFHPDHPCQTVPGAVTVFIVPDLPSTYPGDPDSSSGVEPAELIPDAGALRQVYQHLDAARLVTTELNVLQAPYQRIEINVQVGGDPLDQKSVRTRITESLQKYLHPLRGGPNGNGWPFGDPIRPTSIMREAEKAIDDDLAVQSVHIHVPDTPAPDVTWCEDVAIGPNCLVALCKVVVSFRPSACQSGGLS